MTRWLVLTATVCPHADSGVAVADPERRRRQYAAALAQWARRFTAPSTRIVVAENSVGDPDRLQQLLDPNRHHPQVEYLCCGHRAATGAKGAAEAALLDDTIERLTRRAGGPAAQDLMVKITGRLWVSNAAKVLPPVHHGRQVFVRRTLDGSYVDTRLLAATVSVWRHELAGMADQVEEPTGVFLEHIVAARLARGAATGALSVAGFNRRPRFRGVSGTSGSRYGGLVERARVAVGAPVEALLRHLPPDKQY